MQKNAFNVRIFQRNSKRTCYANVVLNNKPCHAVVGHSTSVNSRCFWGRWEDSQLKANQYIVRRMFFIHRGEQFSPKD